MKTIILKYAIIMTCILMILGSCSADSSSTELPEHDWAGYFVYPMEDVNSFDIDEEGNLYAAAYSSDILKIYDPYGAEIGEKTLPTPYHTTIAVKDGDVFTLSVDGLYRNDEKIYTISFEDSAKDCRIIGEDAYLLYTDSLADLSQAPVIDPVKCWNGERLIRIHLSDLSVSDVICEYPMLICSCEDELWIYGISDEGGYVAPVRDDEEGERILTGSLTPDSFLTVDSSGKFLFAGVAEDSTFTLCMTDPAAGMTNELMPNVAILTAGGIKERDGYVYYLNHYFFAENHNKIERIRRSDYIKNNVPVKLLATEWFSYVPFGCGRTVAETRLSNEEFALAVLSQDPGFDACVLSSSQDFSKNFRDNGSFYALNDVPGAAEYVERCFPALRDAVTNADGEIWALPLSMNVPCAIYNTVNCQAEGFTPVDCTLEELIEESERLYLSDPSRRDICVSADGAIPLLLRYELSGETDALDSADFRGKMDFIKNKMSSDLFGIDVSVESNNLIFRNFGEKMLVMLADTKSKQREFSVNGNIRAVDLFEGKNPADCIFLCVNPSSDNLEATLEYITALCGYLSSKTNDFMLDDRSMYSDSACISELFEIYRDAEIFFRIPDEILLDQVKRYRRDELSLDELIAESGRKLSVYLNE